MTRSYILKTPKTAKKPLNTINSYSKVVRYKTNLQKSLSFLYANNEQIEKEHMETIPFTIASKKITYKYLKKEIWKTPEGGKISHALDS
jgi:hypothetical protein